MIKHVLSKFIKCFVCKKKYNFGAIGQGGYIGKDSILFHEECIFIGDEYRIGYQSSISCYTEYGEKILQPKLIIGDRFLAGPGLKILCAGNISIGNDVTLAGNVFITDENHGLSPLTKNYLENDLIIKNVVIGDGVWLGEDVKILPGVTIGNKAIIGAGSIVTHNIPEYTIAAGNPCRVIKKWDGKTWRDNKYN